MLYLTMKNKGIKIQQVKEYNREQVRRYANDVSNWNPGQGGFPYIGMYLFYTSQGNQRQKGFVISKDNSHYFKLTNREVEKYLKENLK